MPLGNGLVALVDEDDYERISAHQWTAAKFGTQTYARRKNGSQTALMHREVLGLTYGDGLRVDHVNRDGLDNRRSNLRLASVTQNLANATKRRGTYKGVHPHRNRWRAIISANRKQVHIGTFDTEIEAARAYDAAARETFGEFALLNFEVPDA